MYSQTCEIIIMGDFNTNLLENNGSVPADFLSAMLTHYLLPTTMIPTRVSDNSATLIDNTVSSLVAHETTVLINDISDHFTIICELLSSLVA